jgi:hypothetical protein
MLSTAHEGDHWCLLSAAPLARPALAPTTFLEVLNSWGNTWLWDHMSVSGGTEWIHQSIIKGLLVAVTDGSYIRELYPHLCSAAFVLECRKGQGRVTGSFTESLAIVNAYQGELLGLMALHLMLLSVNMIHPTMEGCVEIISDCLGALNRVTYLPPYRISSQCWHSDILKNILVHCRDLSFVMYYLHIKAHQDEQTSFKQLGRKAQLNCICDHAAKYRIAKDKIGKSEQGKMFPLEPVGVFVRGEKMTSDMGSHIWYSAHCQLARTYYRDHKTLSFDQFNAVDWKSIHTTLHNLPRLFQLWASKHILGIAGMMKFLSRQDKQSPLCPSCNECDETCKHIARCPETGCAAALLQSTNKVKKWMDSNNTHGDVKILLLRYLHWRGSISCVECSDKFELPPIVREFAFLQDIIGWDNFAMGMISTKLLAIQSVHHHTNGESPCTTRWITGLITQLLQVTHMQWIYRCVLVHDPTTGTLILGHKAELLKEIEHQLTLGLEGLAEEDRFLLECNFNELTSTSG